MNAEIWALIKRLHEVEHLSISEIARRTLLDRKTVRTSLAQQLLPVRKQSSNRSSKLDPYKDYIAQRLHEYPHLHGTLLFDEIKRRGYCGKLRILWEYLERIRQKQKEAFLRIETLPAEYAQADWANCGSVQIGNTWRKLSCFIMVLSFSRMLYLEFTLSQCMEDFIQCHLNAFRFFGGIPKKILYDNLKTVVLSRIGKAIQFNPKFVEFSGIYLFEPVPCNIARGNEKGKVENGVKYVRGNFLAGRTVSWPQIQADASKWRDETANIRIHGTTRERPIDRFERGIPVEDPKHYEGLIAEKKKAFASKLKDQFLNLGELAKHYLDGLIASELNVHHNIAQIMECVRLYGKTEILQALDHALRHKAYGAPYLKNIILQQRAARGAKEHMPIVIPAKPAWTQLAVEEQNLSLYDDLFDSQPSQTKKDEI